MKQNTPTIIYMRKDYLYYIKDNTNQKNLKSQTDKLVKNKNRIFIEL